MLYTCTLVEKSIRCFTLYWYGYWYWDGPILLGIGCLAWYHSNPTNCVLHVCVGWQEFACNGTVVEHPEYGEVIQLQGDQRQNISKFIKQVGLAREDQIKVCTLPFLLVLGEYSKF